MYWGGTQQLPSTASSFISRCLRPFSSLWPEPRSTRSSTGLLSASATEGAQVRRAFPDLEKRGAKRHRSPRSPARRRVNRKETRLHLDFRSARIGYICIE